MRMIDLINELEYNKINIALDGDDLELSFDGQEINPELLEKIRKNKSQLLGFLKKLSNGASYDEIVPLEAQPSYPVSHNQKRIWILSQFEGGSVVWNMPVSIPLEGNYSATIFEKALRAVIRKHETLRTVFKKDDQGTLQQWIVSEEALDFNLKYHDLSTATNPEAEAQALLQQDAKVVFDLEKGPLLRAMLLKTGTEAYTFYLNMHHIVSDGWSLEILKKDIMTSYVAYQSGKEPALTPLTVQYKDYTVWQLNQLENSSIEKHKNYWLQELSGELPVIDLPGQKKRPKIMTYNGHHLRTFLDKEMTRDLKAFCAKEGGSLFMYLLAAWNVLFHRYLNQKDIIIGTLVAGREHPELEQQIGYYVNTLALRNGIDPQETFTGFYNKVKENTLTAFAHQMYPFDNLLEELDLNRDMSRSPIFDVLLVLHNIREEKQYTVHLSSEEVHTIRDMGATYSKFPVEIEFKELGEHLSFDIKYNTDIYDATLMEGLMKHYKKLLAEIIQTPQAKINEIDMLTEEERQKILYTFNNTEARYQEDSTIIDLFETQVQHTPNNTAVVYRDTRLTFAELNQLANSYAAYLTDVLQVQPGQNIVVSLLHDHHLMAVLLAVKKIGAVYVPVDPQTPQDRIVYIQELSESIAIIDYKLLEEIKQYAVTLETIPTTWNRTSENDIEFIIYTSGSTGKPKGVLIKTKSVNNRLHWMWKNYAFQTGEVCCAKTSISFVDHIWEFFGPLLKGIPLVFYRKTEIIDIPNFIHSLSKENISRIVLVPTLLRAMLNHPELCREKLSKLNIWISSGEALKRRDVDAFYNTMSRSNVRLLNIYGSTEVTADATYYDTYADYNQRKSFQLFDHSLKDEVEALIDIQDVNLNIIANSLEEILQDGDFNSVEFDEKGSSEAYVELLQQKILPNVVNVGSPNYIGHMTGPVPKFIREMNALVTVLNQNQVKIETSLISTLIENQVIGAFHHLVYQKEKAFYETYVQDPASPLGVITNGGTMSNIMALSYALNNALKPKGRFRGLAEEGLVKALKFYDYENVVLLGSPWCHYSFGKALKMLGLGKESFIKVDYEGKDHTAIKDELRTIINRLKSEKTLVLGLIGIAGITESGNIDPLVTLGEIAKEHQIHFHVDAAFGGSFLMDDELRKKFKGIQLADSISICAHKQLYIPIGLSVCLFGDPDFATASENNTHYQARKGSFDLGKYTVEGSRNFMSLILHAALHVFGKEGFAEVVRHNYQTAQHFASLIESSSEFELLYRPDLNIVLYRYIPIAMRGKTQFTDEELEQVNTLNRAIQKQQFHGGNTFVSYTEIYRQGNATRHVAFRTVFMNPYTGPQNLINVLEDQKAIAAKLEGRDEYIPAGAKNENVPIGKPIENVKVYILDEFLNMLPIGVTGEICISGDCISAGYVNVSEQNTQKFIENPFEKGQRLFRTGDLGRRLPDGNIEFVARKDDQVKIRGHRIELGEVEHALLKNEDISEAVVVAKELEPNEVKLIAYLISDKKQQVGSVRNQLKEWLPDYMLPSYVVQLESFPLTSSGKINKKELPNPEKINLLDMETYVPPTNEQERNIVAIWERVLKREHIGMQDDFFALGGHSLKATYLINEYQKDFGVKLELNDIFVNSTVGSHLALLRKAPKVSYTTIPKVPKQQHYAISDAQKRLWVLSQFANSSTAYNMPFSLELKGAIDVSLFQRALIATMDRHEILRTVFREDETGEIRQWIIPEEANQFKLNYLDFSKETEQKSKAKAYISEDSYAAFNLSTGPLLRATLIRLEEEKFVFYYNMHHIISDGVSLEVLKRDVLAFYEAYLKDSTPDIPVLNIQYKDYAAWQLERFNSTAFQEHQQFWLEKLAGKLPVLKFPGEKQRPAIKTYTGNSLVTHISKELCSALKAYCLQQESSVFIGALAVWKIVFHKYTGQSDMMVGTPVAGRDHEELKEQIGCYFNTLLLRNQIQSEATFTETFAQVKQSVLDSFAHKEYPFDKIIEDLNLKRDMSRNPAFDIMFSFHNTGENTLDINIENVDEIVDKGAVHSKLDLLINFAEHGAYFYIDIDYNTNIFQSEFIKELLHNYKRVLQEVLAHPDKPLKELSLQRATVKKKAMSHQKLKKLLK